MPRALTQRIPPVQYIMMGVKRSTLARRWSSTCTIATKPSQAKPSQAKRLWQRQTWQSAKLPSAEEHGRAHLKAIGRQVSRQYRKLVRMKAEVQE